ncbi:RcpC/CpaB family pilus assembly protein [Conexibacter arvalis]|uniref:Pilus assembly protein CpaB n=1 Tax=Conexibacter arvalis TaxID=912552 RepID=A0A840IK75_9ACTN|nr:RcpC/CpaB family pilus assembly protein [Conexibacter arvalis]MBB4664725.1 pilus assembly protein CpaB [Conexibacter arvalis]
MSRRRRALLLLALALLLGGLAASSVSRREAALEEALGPLRTVLVTSAPVAAGDPLADARPVLRTLPTRWAPPDALVSAAALREARAAVALPAGTYVTRAALRAPGAAAGLPVGPGERVADLVAHGDPDAVVAGARVDVLVTRDGDGTRVGATVLALEDVEVLSAAPAAVEEASAGAEGADGRRVAVALRVSVRQAVYLAAAQSFARELRLLPRAPGDRGRGRTGLAVDERLR